MTDSWSAGVAMVELAAKHQVRLVVGQQMRYHPIIEKLRELVREEEIGVPTQLLLDFVGPIEGFTHRAWRQPHPLLIESAFQHVDCIRYVLGADATTVVCEAWTPNYLPQEMTLCAVATYRMENDARVCYRGISSNDVSLQTSWLGRWMLEGEQGVLRVVKNTLTLNGDDVPTGGAGSAPASDIDYAEMNSRVLRDAVGYIRAGVEPGVSGRNCLNSLSMVTGAVESSNTGSRVALYRSEAGR